MIIRRDDADAFDWEGLQIRDMTHGKATAASLAVLRVLPGRSHRRARSTRSEKQYYVVGGRVRFEIDGVESDLEAGDLCVVSAGTPFSYRNQERSAATLVLIHTPPFDPANEEFLEPGP
jgi:mannose-6-phosphate isomerase-like protein (cupin superfamily)